MNNKELIEQIARFVSEEWQQPDIAQGIRLQFAAAPAPTEPSESTPITIKELVKSIQAGEKWKVAAPAPSAPTPKGHPDCRHCLGSGGVELASGRISPCSCTAHEASSVVTGRVYAFRPANNCR
jgi:hypothetical protein